MSDPSAALLTAAAAGDTDRVLEALVGGAAIDARDAEGRTALTLACAQGTRAVVRELVWAGAVPGRQEWMAAGDSGDPALVLLMETADQRAPLTLPQWIGVLARLAETAPDAAQAERDRRDLTRALAELPRALPRTEAALRAAAARVPEALRLLMSRRTQKDVPDLVRLCGQLLSAPGTEVPNAAALALYRLANTGIDIASAVPALVAATATSAASVAALTVYAEAPEGRRRVDEERARALRDPKAPSTRHLDRWLERGDVPVPAVALEWTTPWAQRDAQAEYLIRTGAPVTACVRIQPERLGLGWQVKEFSRHQWIGDFLSTQRPPRYCPNEPPAEIIQELNEIVGGLAWRNRQGGKARFVERLRRQHAHAPSRCRSCAVFGDAVHVDGEKGESLPPESKRLRVLARNGTTLLTCRGCGALFFLKTTSDNSEPWYSCTLQRIDVEQASAFVGTDLLRPPWLEEEE